MICPSQAHRIILGNKLHCSPVPRGLRIARAELDALNGATSINDFVTASADGAEFRPSDLGRYYLATREDSTSDWCPAGLLVVVNLANDDYERICAELDTVNDLLANGAGNVNSLVQYQVETPDGTKVTRMTVRALHKHRADLEARKVAFERSYSGRMPLRFN